MEKQRNSLQSQNSNAKAHTLRRVQSIILNESRHLAQKPAWFKITIVNDDVTPMDYVVQMLQANFYKTLEQATALGAKIQEEGEAACGNYTREIAETKIATIIEDARRYNHPLKCVMRKIK